MLTTMTEIDSKTAAEAHQELCEWIRFRIGNKELARLAHLDISLVEAYAERFYQEQRDLAGLEDLLDEISGTMCHGSTRRSVHRSAMRDAVKCVVRQTRERIDSTTPAFLAPAVV